MYLPYIFYLLLANKCAYTNLSLITNIYAFMMNDHHIMQLCLINSISICLTFHSSLLIDKNTFNKMMIKSNVNKLIFHMFNIIMHIYPVLFNINYLPSDQCILNKFSGFIPLSYNLSWAMIHHRSLNLSKVYVEFTNQEYYFLWFVSFASHIITGIIIC